MLRAKHLLNTLFGVHAQVSVVAVVVAVVAYVILRVSSYADYIHTKTQLSAGPRCKRLSTGASREAPVDNDCFGYWACPDPLAVGLGT